MIDLRAPAGPVRVDQTEDGWALFVKVGKLTFSVTGHDSEAEARDVGKALLVALAKQRGRLPARTADQTPNKLHELLTQEA